MLQHNKMSETLVNWTILLNQKYDMIRGKRLCDFCYISDFKAWRRDGAVLVLVQLRMTFSQQSRVTFHMMNMR